ncbi:hypothetical protein BDK51DRAFT_46120 [Blyttiomyces helicus]|uniref:Uncharacterized protein n=1 Tax=Blyttiomyces helicus TaxID=388810 RepID=A0A4P9VZG8_9FUNG|nr:hypothetical protein BDK51DRAFT_46120 [Blyttiomyces helicus]|eukprot:RKO85209.1 hypothetical protein BDK51DRAFT_46120 [Blyttiomyces helicus]
MSVSGGADFKLPFSFPVNVALGYVFASSNVDGNPAVNLDVPTGISFNTLGGAALTGVNATFKFVDNAATQTSVAGLVSQALTANALTGTVGANSIKLGNSASDLITAFSKVNINLDLNRLTQQLGVAFPIQIENEIRNLDAKIAGASVATLPGRNLAVGAAAQFSLSLPVSINFNTNYFFARATLADQPLASFDLGGLKLQTAGQVNSLNLNTTLNFLDTDATQTAVAQVVTNALTSNKLATKIGADSVVLGFSANPSDVITILSKTVIDLEADQLVSLIGVKLPIDPTTVVSGLNAKIASATLHTLPNKSLFAGGAASVDLPFPITANIGFVGASAALNNQPLVDASIPGIAVAGSTGAATPLNVSATLHFTDTDATQTQLATTVNNFLNEDAINAQASLANLFVGNSNSAADKVNVVIYLDHLARSLGVSVPLDINQFNGVISSTHLGTINVATIPGRAMTVGAGADFKLPFSFPVDVRLGYVFASSNVDGNPAVDLKMPNGIAVNTLVGAITPADVNATLQFTDTDATQSAVAALVQQALTASAISGTVGANSIQLGNSATDLITAFSKIDVNLDLARITKQLGITFPLTLTSAISGLDAKIANLAVSTMPQKRLAVGAAAQFLLTLPVSVNFQTNYFNTRATIDDQPLAIFDLNTIAIHTNGVVNVLNVNTTLNFIDTDATQTAVAQLVTNALTSTSLGGKVGADGIVFGASSRAADVITIASKVVVDLEADQLVSLIGVKLPIDPLAAVSALHAKIASATLHTLPNKSLFAGAAASFNLPFPLTANIGYVGASAALNSQPLADATIPGIVLSGAGFTSSMNVSATLQFTDTDATQTQVATLVNKFLNANALSAQAGIANLFVGNSDSEADKVRFLLNRAPPS